MAPGPVLHGRGGIALNPADWIAYEILGNSLLTWTVSLGIFLAVWLALSLARRWVRGRFRAFATHTDAVSLHIAEHVTANTRAWFLVALALLAASRFLTASEAIDRLIGQIGTIAVVLQLGFWATAALVRFLALRRKQQLSEDPGTVATIDILGFVLRAAVWSMVLLVVLDNLGVNITTLIAGLGVGGIAIALAAQNILGDLFASLSIVLDKPFVVGDFIIIDDYLGNIEKVGLKTTRIRSLSGEQLVFSNNDLLGSRIRNYGRMFERRIVFSLGVTYQTTPEQLRAAPTIIREAIEAHDKVRFDRAHFQSYGDFALLFEVVYYVLSADYNLYMDIQQAVNLSIYERFAAAGIEFAYPTQTILLAREGSG